MSESIFLLEADGGVVELRETEYATEDRLQALVADHPELLAGVQSSSEEGRRWLLIGREIGIPGDESGSNRWSLDHLFLDPDGVPTLVEVKRSADTRIRREVVGQVLDYAANAVLYWPVEQLQSSFESTCESRGEDPADVLSKFIGDGQPEELWVKAKTNLQAGRVRLLFVADRIPQELRRIVEFLNGQMDPAEVLALELPSYEGGGRRTLVPRSFGVTTSSERRKKVTGPTKRQWDAPSFLIALHENVGEEARRIAEGIMAWSDKNLGRRWFGSGSQSGSFVPTLDIAGEQYWPFTLWTYGQVEIQFQWLQNRPPFEDITVRQELRRRLNEIAGVSIPEDGIKRRPSFHISLLTADSSLDAFLSTMEWVVGEVKKYWESERQAAPIE